MSSARGCRRGPLARAVRAGATLRLALVMLLPALLALAAPDASGAISVTEGGALFRQGNEAYEKGDFGSAITAYRRILEGGRESAALHYNLGNAYLKLGELGEAMLSYRRASELSPRSADIRENLEVARSRRADLAPPDAPSPVAALRSWLRSIAPLPARILVTDLLYYAAAAAGVLLLLGRGGRLARRACYVLVPVACVLLALGMMDLRDRTRRPESVLLAREAEARSGPGSEYTTLFTLHEGAEFTVQEARRGWYLIHAGGNLHGWIPAEAAGLIHTNGGTHAST